MTDQPVTIEEVSGKAGVKAFLDLPFSVFRDDPNWVPPLYLERFEHFSPKKNPWFEHGETALFIASRDGQPVGRISAQIDHLHLERHRDGTGFFGFLDAIDNHAVFAALFARAEAWLKAKDMTAARGPFSFSINDETGLLIDGFDTPPSMMMGHARPWYAGHVEACGYAKAKDVIAYDYDITIPLPRAMQGMVRKVAATGDLEVRPISKKNLARDLAIIIDIFNDAWSDNWGFVPFTEAEIRALGNNLKMLVSEGYVAIASYKGEPAAMAVTLPDLNRWIRDLDGRLAPFGWAKLLWRMYARPPEAARMPLMGVKRPFHGTPVGSALALSVIDAVRSYHLAQGTRRAELSWILEDNLAMRRVIESLGGVAYKTYRIYERKL